MGCFILFIPQEDNMRGFILFVPRGRVIWEGSFCLFHFGG